MSKESTWAMELSGTRRELHYFITFKTPLLANCIFRYKAEVDVDGRELALYYLRKKNLRSMLDEVNAMKTEQELETFLLQHGENIVDCLGEQVLSLVIIQMLFSENISFPFTFRWIGLR